MRMRESQPANATMVDEAANAAPRATIMNIPEIASENILPHDDFSLVDRKGDKKAIRTGTKGQGAHSGSIGR